MELWDLQYLKTGAKKRIRYPRPWPSTTRRTTKPDASLTQDEIIAALRMAGHTGPLPGEPAVELPQQGADGRWRDTRGRYVTAPV